MSGLERAMEDAVLIWTAGSRAGFGHPFRRSIRVEVLEEPFILDFSSGVGQRSDGWLARSQARCA